MSQSSLIKIADHDRPKSKIIKRLKSSSELSQTSLLRRSFLSSHNRSYISTTNKPIVIYLYRPLLTGQATSQITSNFLRQVQESLSSNLKTVYFDEYSFLLTENYKTNNVFYFVVTPQLLQACQNLLVNERDLNKQKSSIYLLCIFKKEEQYKENTKKQKKRDGNKLFSYYFRASDEEVDKNMFRTIFSHCRSKEMEELSTSKRWVMTNSSSQSKPESPHLHFICEEIVYEIIYEYLERKKRNDVRIDSFQTFDEVISLVKTERVSAKKDLLNSSYYTSMKDINSFASLRSIPSEQVNSSMYFPMSQSHSNLSLRLKQDKLKKIQQSGIKIIICRRYNNDIKKLRALVNNQKGKWLLWEITDQSADIISKIRACFEKLGNNHDYQEEELSELECFSKEEEKKKEITQETKKQPPKLVEYKSPQKQIKTTQKYQAKKSLLPMKPILPPFSKIDKVAYNITKTSSKPISSSSIPCKFYQEFQPLPEPQITLIPLSFSQSIFDKNMPSFHQEILMTRDEYVPKPLKQNTLLNIKDIVQKSVILKPHEMDERPVFCESGGEPDSFEYFQIIPMPIFKKPEPQIEDPNAKVLFFKEDQQEYTTQSTYSSYKKVKYQNWQDLYKNLMTTFKDRQNYTLKAQNQNIELVQLQPSIYLEKHLFMKEFKYFSAQSREIGFNALPETPYKGELSLSSKLLSDESPGVVLYSQNSQKWIYPLKHKYEEKYQWFCLQDQSWIDEEGNLLNETNMVKLIRKINLYISMFNTSLLDTCKGIDFFKVKDEKQEWNIYQENFKKSEVELKESTQEDIIQQYQSNTSTILVIFLANSSEELKQLQKSSNGRLKLIFLNTNYCDTSEFLSIKYSEINPVIKNIQKIQKQGRKNIIISHKNTQKSLISTLIQQKQLQNTEEKQYESVWPDLQKIFSQIKGMYRKVFMICYEDEKKDIEKLFNNYNVHGMIHLEEQIQFSILQRDWSPTSSIKSINSSKKNSKRSSRKISPLDSVIKQSPLESYLSELSQHELAIQSGHQSSKQVETPQYTPQSEQKIQLMSKDSLPIESRDTQQQPESSQKMISLDDFSKIYIVYQQNMDMQNKRELLAACTQNQKIVPIVYNSISLLKELMGSNLILLMMKEIPMELFNQFVEKEQLSIVFKGNFKAILPKYTNINLRSITSLFEIQSISSIKKMESQQVSSYLTKFEEEVISIKKAQKIDEYREDYGLLSSSSSQKTSMTSFSMEIRMNESQISKIRANNNKNLTVLLVEFSKRNKYNIVAVKNHLILQTYTDVSTFQTEVRKKIGRHLVLAIVTKDFLSKAVLLKQKHENFFIFLQHTKNGEGMEEINRNMVTAQFAKSSQFQKFLNDIKNPNSDYNPEQKILYNSDIQKTSQKTSTKEVPYNSLLTKKSKPQVQQKKQGKAKEDKTQSPVKGKMKSPMAKQAQRYFNSEYYKQ